MRRLLWSLAVLLTLPAAHAQQAMPGMDMAGMDMPGMAMPRPHTRKPPRPRHPAAVSTMPAMPGMTSDMTQGMNPGMTMDAPPSRGRIVHRAADAPEPGVMQTHLPGVMPVMDQGVWLHGVLDEFEGRVTPGTPEFRWDGEAWYGGDYNRLWLKSEGTLTPTRQGSRLSDGDQEALYSHAISRYFDLQGGVRVDLDDGPARTWAAFGVQGLALYQFELQATGYVSDRGRTAARVEGSYDLLLTNRLILQPQVELNAYSKADRARGNGSGLSEIDAGLRLRYEIWRKFAPYIAVTYAGSLGQGRRFAHDADERSSATRLTFGIRSWF